MCIRLMVVKDLVEIGCGLVVLCSLCSRCADPVDTVRDPDFAEGKVVGVR